jgi:hypothetical protein
MLKFGTLSATVTISCEARISVENEINIPFLLWLIDLVWLNKLGPELMSRLGCEANFEFETLWQTIYARYAISARTLALIAAVRCSTFVKIVHFRSWH